MNSLGQPNNADKRVISQVRKALTMWVNRIVPANVMPHAKLKCEVSDIPKMYETVILTSWSHLPLRQSKLVRGVLPLSSLISCVPILQNHERQTTGGFTCFRRVKRWQHSCVGRN